MDFAERISNLFIIILITNHFDLVSNNDENIRQDCEDLNSPICYLKTNTININENTNRVHWTKKPELKSIINIEQRQNNYNFRNSSSDKMEVMSKHRILVNNFKKTWPVQLWRKYGIFTDDYIELLNDHWLQFSPPPEALHHALGGFYIIFATVGLCGNMLVVFMYIRFEYR